MRTIAAAFGMRTQRQVDQISTAISLISLAMGFSVLGLLIVAKEHHGGASITGGIISILLGAAFLMAACLHWKCWDQIQGGLQVEEDPAAAEIASQTRRSRPALNGTEHLWLQRFNRVQRGVGIDQAGIDVDFSSPTPVQKTF